MNEEKLSETDKLLLRSISRSFCGNDDFRRDNADLTSYILVCMQEDGMTIPRLFRRVRLYVERNRSLATY